MLGDWIAWMLSLIFGFSGYWWLVRRYPTVFRKPNYLQEPIPASAGCAVVLSCEPAYTWLVRERYAQSAAIVLAALLLVVGFGILGLVDDMFGDRTVGGLKGHLKALLERRRLTTGLIKAGGGVALSLIAGFLIYADQWYLAITSAIVIALTANSANLMDTRPGRTSVCVLLFGAAGIIFGISSLTLTKYLVFVPPLAAVLVLYVYDRKAKLMLGDTGSNALGALVGLIWAVCSNPLELIVFLTVLVWFHWWTEKHSLNQTIERLPFLKKLDRWTGVRTSV